MSALYVLAYLLIGFAVVMLMVRYMDQFSDLELLLALLLWPLFLLAVMPLFALGTLIESWGLVVDFIRRKLNR